jgi:beta-galactosidase
MSSLARLKHIKPFTLLAVSFGLFHEVPKERRSEGNRYRKPESAKFLRGLLLAFVIVGLNDALVCQAQSFENKAYVKNGTAFPQLWINGRQVPPFAYMSYLGDSRFYKEVAEQGIDIFCLPAYLGDQGINSTSGIKPFRPSFWIDDNRFDFSIIQKEFETLTRVKSDAKVIIRIHLDAPQWWQKKNPSEVCLLPSGESLRVSYASEKWRKDAGMALHALLNWIKKSEFNANLIGIHVAGGSTEEWFYHYKDHFYDESPARSASFRKWLREKYHNQVSQLKNAWKLPSVTFENAVTADISGKIRGEKLVEKRENMQLLDSYDFHAHVILENIRYFSKLVKDNSHGRLLTGTFYGYHLFVHDPRRGHGALGDLLKCPTIDYISSPNDYRRESGLDWMPMAAIRSVQLHGKLWLAENDTRTRLTRLLRDVAPDINPEGDWYSASVWKGPETMELSESFLWKNAGRMLAYGYGGWWFDMWGGWFSDPALLAVLRKVNQLAQKFPDKPADPGLNYKSEVAVVVDEKLQFYDASLGRITGSLLSNRYALGNIGTPFDVFLRSDLDSLAGKGYKTVWFLGLHEPSERESNLISAFRSTTETSLVTDPAGTSVYRHNLLEDHFPGKLGWKAVELRELFSKAGVHIFSDRNDVVYTGNGWLTVHCKEAGQRSVQLPAGWQVSEVRTGESYPISNGAFVLNAREGETFLFRIK